MDKMLVALHQVWMMREKDENRNHGEIWKEESKVALI